MRTNAAIARKKLPKMVVDQMDHGGSGQTSVKKSGYVTQ